MTSRGLSYRLCRITEAVAAVDQTGLGASFQVQMAVGATA